MSHFLSTLKISRFRYFALGILFLLSIPLASAFGAGANGLFGDYFMRIVGDCSANQVITGFDTTSSAYGTRKCSNLQTLLANIFSSSSAPAGQAVVGFNPDGTLKYASVNLSQWTGTPPGDITYTGGNVGIGISSPSAKLHIYDSPPINSPSLKIEKPYYGGWLQFSPMNGFWAYNNMVSYGDQAIIFSTDNVGTSDAGNGLVIAPWSTNPKGGGIKIMEDGRVKMSKLCLGGECRTSFQQPISRNQTWTRVHTQFNTDGRGPHSYDSPYFNLTKDVLGVRIWMSSDDGGGCIAFFGDIWALGVLHSSKMTSFAKGAPWTASTWNRPAGTNSHDFFPLQNYVGKYAGVDNYVDQVIYDGTAGMTYIPANTYARVSQWYNDGGGSAGVTCNVDVMYADD